MKYYIGGKWWKNRKWSGEAFFPPNLDPKDYFTYYSKLFDLVELDLSNSTDSYNNKLHDDILLFKKWVTDTPHNFRFTIRLPGTS